MATVAASAVAEEGSPSKRFWKKYRKESAFAAYSPFIVCLAAGDLEMDVFRQFISQDVFFQKAYVQAYEVAEECADDDDAKAVIDELREAISRGQKMQGTILQEWGVDIAKEITPNSSTVKFTDFLQATASGKVDGGKIPSKIATPFEKTKIAAYVVGAMTPCMRLYSFLIKELNILLQDVEKCHPYKKWIDNFSTTGFEVAATQNEELLDKLTISLTGEELELVEKLYHRAMKLEIDFFCSQPIVQQTVVPLARWINLMEHHFVISSDFDLTCSVIDSSAILAEIAIFTAKKAIKEDTEMPNEQKGSDDLRSTWNALSSLYTEEFQKCIETILLTEKVEGFNYEGLCRALEHLSDFEKHADSRVIESEVLKGLNLDDIKRAGERMILQDGCMHFFQQCLKEEKLNAEIHVLSYCWCGDLIRAAFSAGGLNVLEVHSNELNFDESRSTGEIIRNMESPLDKLKIFKDVLKNSSNTSKHISVYIGDSVNDLLCLLEADVGIVVGSRVSLRKVGAHFGVSFMPLFPDLVKKQRQLADGGTYVWKGLSGVLYTVSDWTEINAFVLGA